MATPPNALGAMSQEINFRWPGGNHEMKYGFCNSDLEPKFCRRYLERFFAMNFRSPYPSRDRFKLMRYMQCRAYYFKDANATEEDFMHAVLAEDGELSDYGESLLSSPSHIDIMLNREYAHPYPDWHSDPTEIDSDDSSDVELRIVELPITFPKPCEELQPEPFPKPCEELQPKTAKKDAAPMTVRSYGKRPPATPLAVADDSRRKLRRERLDDYVLDDYALDSSGADVVDID